MKRKPKPPKPLTPFQIVNAAIMAPIHQLQDPTKPKDYPALMLQTVRQFIQSNKGLTLPQMRIKRIYADLVEETRQHRAKYPTVMQAKDYEQALKEIKTWLDKMESQKRS
jgi:hypothetical protein